MADHTPGPWRLELHDHGDGEEWCINALNEGGMTDHIIAWANPGSEVDARLIAAAPALLEALERIASMDSYRPNEAWPQNVNRIARAAIAKARGES